MQDEVKGAGTPVILRDRFSIFPATPLAELSTPSAQAYAASDRRDPGRALFALVCRPELPARANVMRGSKGAQAPGLMQLVEWGPCEWPPLQRRCMAVVYDRPVGGRVMSDLKAEIKRIDEYDIRKSLAPLVGGLRELTSRGITHRAIRPTNMFYMDPAHERMVFGDAVTAPPAFDQPLAFETIESGMADRAARGSGSYAEDLYAFGATLVVLMLGRNPVAHLDEQTLLKQKIAQGSYATLVGDERLPLGIIEVLRGLLCDDREQRWDIEALEMWLGGRRLSPLQTKLEKRAQRSFPFNGKEYDNARELAAAFSRHWEAAIPPVLEGKLELWLRRALEDKERAEAVSSAVRNVGFGSSDARAASDIVLARVCMILDPNAPIRYRGFSAMPDGFGSALAVLMAEKQDPKLFAEVMLREIPRMWFESRPDYSPDNSMLETNFRDLRDFLQQTAIGYGLERCLYELNESLPCLSALLAKDYVTDIKELLPALNNAKPSDAKDWPIDRHIAAFIGARFKTDVDRTIRVLSDPDPAMATLGMLNLLALMQWKLQGEPMYNLAGWVGGLLGPVIESFHSRERRRELERDIPKLVRQGSLLEMYRLLDDATARQKDKDGFAWAQAVYASADYESRTLEAGGPERDQAALRLGQQMAALTSVVVALLTVTILVIVKVW